MSQDKIALLTDVQLGQPNEIESSYLHFVDTISADHRPTLEHPLFSNIATQKEKSCLQKASHSSCWWLDKHQQCYNYKANLPAAPHSLSPGSFTSFVSAFLVSMTQELRALTHSTIPQVQTWQAVPGVATWSTNSLGKAEGMDHAQVPARSSRRQARDRTVTRV